ncbi:hypothetical protein LY78DRAFT_356267 [Colletotrichum sublineola]|nr:hypothetical protein LY78DRAFT_356267 [Colletotrichum sublineola]
MPIVSQPVVGLLVLFFAGVVNQTLLSAEKATGTASQVGTSSDGQNVQGWGAVTVALIGNASVVCCYSLPSLPSQLVMRNRMSSKGISRLVLFQGEVSRGKTFSSVSPVSLFSATPTETDTRRWCVVLSRNREHRACVKDVRDEGTANQELSTVSKSAESLGRPFCVGASTAQTPEIIAEPYWRHVERS